MRSALKILVAVAFLALLAGQGIRESQNARAQYDMQQLLLGQSGVINPDQPVDSLLRVSSILEQYGLDKGHEKEFCIAKDFLKLVDGGWDAVSQRLEDAVVKALNQIMKDVLTKYVQCELANIDPIDLYFTTIPNPLPECTSVTGADFTEVLKESAKKASKDAYVARCVVDSSLKRVTDTVDKMLQQMGPEGGPGVATDWLDTLNKAPYRMAQRRLWTMLAYTDICPYFKEQALEYFQVPASYRTNPPDISPTQLSVDGGVPFELRAACTLPADYAPTSIATADGFIANGGFSLLSQLSERQNYPAGFILMAEEEFQKQVAALSTVRQYQLVAGGGILGAYQPCIKGPNGDRDCVADGSIVQAPGALQNIYTDTIKSQTDALNNSANAGQKILTDISSRIAVRLLNFASQPIPLRFNVSPGDTEQALATPTPTPTPAPIPGSGDADDPLCTGGLPGCTCVLNSPTLQTTYSQGMQTNIQTVIQNRPDLFVSPGSNQIAEGISRRTVLEALCPGTGCKPSPLRDDSVVVLGPTTVSMVVITPAGALRTDGGQVMAMCPAGVQD